MEYKNAKGKTYYLHERKAYYFSKNPEGSVDMPEGFEIVENRGGLPLLKRKPKPGPKIETPEPKPETPEPKPETSEPPKPEGGQDGSPVT